MSETSEMSDTTVDTVDTPESTTLLPIQGFFRLPPEIRARIYRSVLLTTKSIDWPVASFGLHLCPALLRTCKQVYEEAAPLLYQHNRFNFSHPSDCNVFRWIMDNKQVPLISTVSLRIRDKDLRLWTSYFGSDDPIRSLSADLPNLQNLVVFLRQNGWGFGVDPDEAFKHWERNSRLKSLCMSLEPFTSATVTVVCSLRIAEHHFEHIKISQAASLSVSGDCARTTKATEMYSSKVVLELLSPKACSERHRHVPL